MHILLVPHTIEICTATIIILVLLLWPIYVCRELTDTEIEKAYSSDQQCAQELQVCFMFLIFQKIFTLSLHFQKKKKKR